MFIWIIINLHTLKWQIILKRASIQREAYWNLRYRSKLTQFPLIIFHIYLPHLLSAVWWFNLNLKFLTIISFAPFPQAHPQKLSNYKSPLKNNIIRGYFVTSNSLRLFAGLAILLNLAGSWLLACHATYNLKLFVTRCLRSVILLYIILPYNGVKELLWEWHRSCFICSGISAITPLLWAAYQE